MIPTLIFLLCLMTLVNVMHPAGQLVSSAYKVPQRFVVIDAGHGGIDGGAVSLDGSVKESDLNLQITRHLALVLLFCGEEVALTRSGEEDLSSTEATTIREKKVSDLKNRVAAVNTGKANFLISIHQNSLPQHPEVRGAQVFYNSVTTADRLASAVQQAINKTVNTDNEKTTKAIGKDIFLMREVQCPAILAECGFLSNQKEVQLLCSETHQMNLALSIAAGYLSYVSEVDVT